MITSFSILKNFPAYAGYTDKELGNIDYRFGAKNQVGQNRQKICQNFGLKVTDLFEMDQVHSCRIKVITKTSPNFSQATDSLITTRKNTLLLVKTADCLPVFFFDPENQIIAIIHVGWRGAAEKIFLETLFFLTTNFNSRPEKLIAGIGPGIRSCCLQEKEFIQEHLPEWKKFIKPGKNGRKNLDLPGFVKKKLLDYGLKTENIQDLGICTVCNKKFFSHQRSLKFFEKSGRMATVIGLKK